MSVESVVAAVRAALYHYLKNHSNVLLMQVLSSGNVKIPSGVSVTPETFSDHLNVLHFQNWQDKSLNGQLE